MRRHGTIPRAAPLRLRPTNTSTACACQLIIRSAHRIEITGEIHTLYTDLATEHVWLITLCGVLTHCGSHLH